jgi:hypothetical protein
MLRGVAFVRHAGVIHAFPPNFDCHPARVRRVNEVHRIPCFGLVC